MKKVTFLFCLMAVLVACQPTDQPSSEVDEPNMTQFGSQTKSELQHTLGEPIETESEDFDVVFNFSQLFSFTSPYHNTSTPLVDRKVEVLKYAGQNEDEVCRLYLFMNDKLAASIYVYNKNTESFKNEINSYLAQNEKHYVGMQMNYLYNLFGFSADDIDAEHQYMNVMLNSSLYIAQQGTYDPNASHIEQWLNLATGYSLIAYGGVPTNNVSYQYSALTYVDVRAIYEFAHFSDVFGLIDFVFDMAF